MYHCEPLLVTTQVLSKYESSPILERTCFAVHTKEDRFIESCPD